MDNDRYDIPEDTDEAPIEEVEFVEPSGAVEPEPAEPEDEPSGKTDGTVLEAPEGYQYATYEGHAEVATLGDITLKHGIPTLVSKEQALTLLTHPFERFTVADEVPVPSPDEE